MKDEERIYHTVDPDLYSEVTRSANPVRRWFHLSRYRISEGLVRSRYADGMRVADLGCASCEWNAAKMPVTGVDLNEELLRVALRQGRISDYRVAAVSDSGLEPGAYDIVTLFEILEHISDYPSAISEARRILRPGGWCIVSVPYDVAVSLWRPLFFLQVLLHGYLMGDEYYKSSCGHVNHFSRDGIRRAFLDAGFEGHECALMRWFTIFCVFRKPL